MIGYSHEALQEMKGVDIRTVEMDGLADIRDISIQSRQPVHERMQSFLEQIKNPYCYRHGKYVIKIGFSESDITMEERLKEYVDRVSSAKKY